VTGAVSAVAMAVAVSWPTLPSTGDSPLAVWKAMTAFWVLVSKLPVTAAGAHAVWAYFHAR